MSIYGDNCHEHDLPYGECIECERDVIEKLRAENDRLRKALKRIASNEADDAMRECIREGMSYHRILEDIAREALSGSQKHEQGAV